MSSDRLDPPSSRCAPAPRTLLIFCDSLSYYGPQGGLPSDDPRIWPNIVARQLGWDVDLIGRIDDNVVELPKKTPVRAPKSA